VVIVGDVFERYTNGLFKATPHRVLDTPWERRSIIRFNALTPKTVIQPLQSFVTPQKPSLYTPMTMEQHMETTMENLRLGKGAWCSETDTSLTATYRYE
jgi:isopenicillin N synthase-like dioxygenase